MDGREVITLNNGARIVFDAMPGLRTAAVGVFLGAGARHESDAHSGLRNDDRPVGQGRSRDQIKGRRRPQPSVRFSDDATIRARVRSSDGLIGGGSGTSPAGVLTPFDNGDVSFSV